MPHRVNGFARSLLLWGCVLAAAGCGDNANGTGGAAGSAGSHEGDGSAASGATSGGAGRDGEAGTGSTGRTDGGGTGGTTNDGGGTTGGSKGDGGGASGSDGGPTGGTGTGGTGTGGSGGGPTKCRKNADCSDGKFCNGAETCDPNDSQADAEGCIDGTPPDCRDKARCTVDACDEANDECTHTATDARCDNGDFCDGNETCDPDDAMSDPVSGCVLDPVDPCDDGFDCTADGCNEGDNTCINLPSNVRCADPDFCFIETCEPTTTGHDGRGCVKVDRTPLPVAQGGCDDGIDCTVDSCNETADVCENAPDDDYCHDHDDVGFCDGRDTCNPATGCEDGPTKLLSSGSTGPTECDDGFSCTDDGCVNDACDHVKDTVKCGDTQACDGLKFCDPSVGAHDANGCVVGVPLVCNDHIDCTVDSCDTTLPAVNQPPGIFGACKVVNDNNFCRDDEFCNGQEFCAPGAVGSDPDTGCHDGPLCPACKNPLESPPNCTVTLAVPCGCIDGIPCTVDDCNPTGGLGGLGACDNEPEMDEHFCNAVDGFRMCNGDEMCVPQLSIADANGCIEGIPYTACDDGRSCTRDTCDTLTDDCLFTPVPARCNDSKFCDGYLIDGAEYCVGVMGPHPTDPNAPPVMGDPVTGCFSLLSTDCSAAACAPPVCDVPCTGPTCDDAVTCTDERCNEATDSCVRFFDHSACNPEICSPDDAMSDPGSGCVAGQACTGDGDCPNLNRCFPESCIGGICVPAMRDCDDGIGCTRDFCTTNTMDPRADGNGCVNDPKDIFGNNTACDDGNPCNGDETCDKMFDCAIPPQPLVCNDGVDCTVDSCDPFQGCVFTPNDANCPDFFCNDYFCDRQLDCQPLPPTDCDDGIACTSDSCNETDHCVHTPVPAACADPSFCNGVEVCVAGPGGGCQPGLPVQCDDGISCDADLCIEASGQCEYFYNPTPTQCAADPSCTACTGGQFCTQANPPCQTGQSCTPPTSCEDGNFCNGSETCSSQVNGVPGVCQPGSPPSCDDGNPCTDDACAPMVDTCTHTPHDGDGDGFGAACGGGGDCNDTDPAINPNALEICDGIDNDCVGGVDNGLVSPGLFCNTSAECCSQSCVNNVCTLPFPQCKAILDACDADYKCCSGACDTYVDGQQHCLQRGACALSGTACDTASDCCSLGCVNGVCSANPADTCKAQATACTSNAQCCSNKCNPPTGGTCAAPAVTSCKVSGETCSSNGNCCSGFCYFFGGTGRCAPHDSCRGQGEICTEDRECCVGTKLPGADPSTIRGCDDVTHQCEFLGSCSTAGEACTGTRNCCSALCVDAGWGVGICEFLAGCRPYGEICTEDFQCCSGVVNPNDLNGDSRCSNPDPTVDNLRRCLNVPGCVDPGEICAQGGSNNCCVLKSRGCTATGLGVSRCNSSATCIDVGQECQFSEQCCNGKPCIPDQFGVFRCSTTCVGQGSGCGSHADCCPGNICYEGVCVTNNTGCVPVGQDCPQALGPCCSGLCSGGSCIPPP